jgi:hypothetical protein
MEGVVGFLCGGYIFVLVCVVVLRNPGYRWKTLYDDEGKREGQREWHLTTQFLRDGVWSSGLATGAGATWSLAPCFDRA